MSEQAPQTAEPPVGKIALALGGVLVTLIVAVLVVVSSGAGTPVAQQVGGTGPAIVDESAFSTGVNAVEPRLITDVPLVDMEGRPARLSDLRGRYTLLYFGYTFCPDFCPATLTDYRLVARALGEDAERVNFVLMSVDPQRDTPEVLRGYVRRFNPAFLAFTAEPAVLDALVADFGAFYDIMDDGSSPYYMVNHTASTFVLDPQGRLVTVYAFGTEVEYIVADLRQKLAAP